MVINKFYLENITKVKNSLSENKDFPSATLFNFFEEKYFIKLQKKLKSLNYNKESNPLTHSYSKAESKTEIKVLNDKTFLYFISKLTDIKVKKLSVQILSFGWNDYTILHDAVKEEIAYDIIFDFTDLWNSDFGGQIIYIDGSGDYFEIPQRRNTITIVKRKKGLRRFVKYVNNHAGRKKRYFLISKIKMGSRLY